MKNMQKQIKVQAPRCASNRCGGFDRPNFRTAYKISARSVHARTPDGENHISGNLQHPQAPHGYMRADH